jgi:iron complex transport system ATP-binding protein
MGRFMPTKFLGILDSNDKKIIEEVLQQTELWSLKDRLINTLSSGEKQRVQIARALAQEPEFLLLDEPFNFLDIAQLAKTIAILQQRHQDYGTGMLIVSHNTRILAVITAKTLFLKNGKVLLFGTTNEVLTTENISKYFTTGQAILF